MPGNDEVASIEKFWEDFRRDLDAAAAEIEQEWKESTQKDHSQALKEPLLKMDANKLVVNFSEQVRSFLTT